MPKTIQLLAPAKINLILKVLGKRPDGYHELFTVFQKVSWFDTLVLYPAQGLSLEVKGKIDVPLEGNLCLKAAKLFLTRSGVSEGVKIILYKEIPYGTGLGGGSSDAAATIKGLHQLYPVFTEEELLNLGAEIGADVPFFISRYSTALGRGKGEVLTPWPSHPAWYVILCPSVSVSTPKAYQLLRLTTWQEPPNYEPDQPLWWQGLVNDFEDVILARFPFLRELKARLLERGAQAALLTGSGSALYGVFEDKARAQEAAAYFSERGLKVKVVSNYVEK